MFIIQDHNDETLLFEISQPGLQMMIDVSAWTELNTKVHEFFMKSEAKLKQHFKSKRCFWTGLEMISFQQLWFVDGF